MVDNKPRNSNEEGQYVENLRQLITECRMRKKLNQTAFAKLCGVHNTAITQLETPQKRKQLPTISVLHHLASGMDMTLLELLSKILGLPPPLSPFEPSSLLDRLLNQQGGLCSFQTVAIKIAHFRQRRLKSQLQTLQFFQRSLKDALLIVAERYRNYSNTHQINWQTDIVIAPTSQGAVVSFSLPASTDIHLRLTEIFLKKNFDYNRIHDCKFLIERQYCQCHANFYPQIGIADESGILIKDHNGYYHVMGNVVEAATRITELVGPSQIGLTPTAYTQLINTAENPLLCEYFIKQELSIGDNREPEVFFLYKGQTETLSAPPRTAQSIGLPDAKSHTNIKELIQHLLTESSDKIKEAFRYYNIQVAHTEEDEAGLALISKFIERSVSEIKVIGRGPRSVDTHLYDYVVAVAKAILRGVTYTRILIVDPALPENALLWLLFLERFLYHSVEYHQRIRLYIRLLQGTTPFSADQSIDLDSNRQIQFQLIDDFYFHRITRNLKKDPDTGEVVPDKSHSTFAISPDEEVQQYIAQFKRFVNGSGNLYTHEVLSRLLQTLLNTQDSMTHRVLFKQQELFKVIRYLNQLHISEFPPTGLHFVGCLNPLNYSHQAALQFSQEMAEKKAKRVLTVPFNSYTEALQMFFDGDLDYLCIPTKNTTIGKVHPPGLTGEDVEKIEKHFKPVSHVEIPIDLVIASQTNNPTDWKVLLAVDTAFTQVKPFLTDPVSKLPRSQKETPQSSLDSALMAKENASFVAVTSRQAADDCQLPIYNSLEPLTKNNKTIFTIFGLNEDDSWLK